MPTPTLANVPQNQINALPVFQTGGASGSSSIVGGQVVRRWTAAQTGIDTEATGTDANGHVFLATDYLDTSGCRSFTALMLRSSAGAALAATPAMLLYFQMRIDSSDAAPSSLPGLNLAFCGMSVVNANTITWPLMGSAGEVQRALRCWDLSTVAGVAGAVGSQSADVRLLMSFGVAAVNADNRFSLVLWGTS